jgi:hypothetical protein
MISRGWPPGPSCYTCPVPNAVARTLLVVAVLVAAGCGYDTSATFNADGTVTVGLKFLLPKSLLQGGQNVTVHGFSDADVNKANTELASKYPGAKIIKVTEGDESSVLLTVPFKTETDAFAFMTQPSRLSPSGVASGTGSTIDVGNTGGLFVSAAHTTSGQTNTYTFKTQAQPAESPSPGSQTTLTAGLDPHRHFFADGSTRDHVRPRCAVYARSTNCDLEAVLDPGANPDGNHGTKHFARGFGHQPCVGSEPRPLDWNRAGNCHCLLPRHGHVNAAVSPPASRGGAVDLAANLLARTAAGDTTTARYLGRASRWIHSCNFRTLGPLPLRGLLVRPGTAKPIGDREELVDRHVYHPRGGQDCDRGHPRPTSLPVIDSLP